MTSTISAYRPAIAATSLHVPSRGSTSVWSAGSNPASAPSYGVKNGRMWRPPNTPSSGPSRTVFRRWRSPAHPVGVDDQFRLVGHGGRSSAHRLVLGHPEFAVIVFRPHDQH